jgi:hypothetical protein
MVTRLTFTLFRDCTIEQLRTSIEEAIATFGGTVTWNTADEHLGTRMATHHGDAVHTVFIAEHGTYGLLRNVGEGLDIPWMELRIQEGSHWDYSLMKGSEDVCSYSTFPEYFDTAPAFFRMFKRNARRFSKTWGVPLDRIDRYHLEWNPVGSESFATRITNRILGLFSQRERDDADGLLMDDDLEFARKGKAYPSDESEYGDFWQMLDFLRAIGGADPREHGTEHRIDLGRYGKY